MRDIWERLEQHSHHAEMVRSSKHAAAIIYKGMILSWGLNGRKTHPMMRLFGRNEEAIYLHAEIDAIIRAINKYGVEILKKSDLYVLRTTKTGSVGYSKPCSGCEKAIKTFGIKRVFHS